MHSNEMVGLVLGHYRILRPLGYGGSATVFLAQDINLQREVALKVFQPPPGETGDFLRRFAREARVLAQLDHPNILPVYDYGEHEGVPYLVMPYVAGGSLRDRLQKHGSLPAVEAIRLSAQVLNALQYAHERGLIHRDIKPGNLLCKVDGTLLLSDFGLVKIMPADGVTSPQGTLTVGNQNIAGTPDYMAPEQIKGQPMLVSDIYSMGAVIYEMLTGTHLFSAENYMGILVQHMYEPPRPLRALNSQVSANLEAVVMRALEKDPARRHQSAADFRLALLQADDETVTFVSEQNALPSVKLPLSQAPSAAGNQSDKQSSAYAAETYPMTPTTPPASYYPGPQPGKQTPLIITLIMLMIVILISTASLLYAQGIFTPLFGRTSSPTAPSHTPINNGSVTKGGLISVPGKVITAPVPPTTTTCPAPGTARADVTAPLALGTDQNIVYIVNEGTSNKPTFGVVKRRDMTTGVTGVEIARIPDLRISDEQVSQDGQWVLFTVANGDLSQMQLRLVRMDGQGLQTLYCGQNIYGTQWSFDQKSIVFNVGLARPITYLLTIASGNVQQELVPQGNLAFVPRTWLDNSHIYMIAAVPQSDAPAHNIYLLDTRKGPDQHEGDLQTIATTSLTCHDFDSSYDSTHLFISSCTSNTTSPGAGRSIGPSHISVQPATGGTAKDIYTNPIRAVIAVRSITPNTLLLMIENNDSDTSMNGLWRINGDGTHLQRLTTDVNSLQSLCPFTQFAWSNVSRNGDMYAVQGFNAQKQEYTLSTGSMDGGPLNTFADISDGTELFLAGWTNM